MTFRNSLAIGAAALALVPAMVSVAEAQQTSTSVRGSVTGARGAPVAGATIRIVHTPSGTTETVQTNETGGFFAGGLRVGGPYMIAIEAPGYQGDLVDGLNFAPGVADPLSFRLDPAAGDEIVVTGRRIATLGVEYGAGSSFSENEIANQPSVSRDLTDTLIQDPLANTNGATGNLSIAGVNPRFNGLAIDGVLVQDDFGLGSSTYPTSRSPISLDTVEAASIVASDYSVQSSGYQGGLVNVVTKSGTNEFHGSLYGYYQDESFIGDSAFGEDFETGAFEETEWGATLGGPILKDRLFFFAAYDEYETSSPVNFAASDVQDDIEDTRIFTALNDIIQNVYGFDAGGRPSSASTPETSKRYLAKLDWNITGDHRASLSYNRTEESEVSVGNTEFVTAWYAAPAELESWSGQIYSDWTDNFSTTFRASLKDFSRLQNCNAGEGVGEYQIRLSEDDLAGTALEGALSSGASDVTFIAGCDRFRHGNTFEDQRAQFFGQGDYILGDHLLTFGGEYETYELDNLFVSDSEGTFIFETLGQLQNQQAEVAYRNAVTNDEADAAAAWGYDKISLFAQDEWAVTPRLTVNAGVRYEQYVQDDKPPLRQDFIDLYGRTNQSNLDGVDLIQPRFGFRFEPTDRTVISGGFGLFAGGDPKVWISNAFTPQIFQASGVFSGVNPNTVPQPLLDEVAASDPSTPSFIDTIDPDFELPSQYKASLRLDQEFDLDLNRFGIGLDLGDDYLFSTQYLYQNTRYGYRWVNLAQTRLGLPAGVAPDGRPIYSDLQALGVNNAIELTNSEDGEGQVITFALAKDYDFGFGFDVSYAYQDIESTTPGTSSRGVSNFRSMVTVDRNNPRIGRAPFETEHKFALSFGYERDFFRDLTSRLDVFSYITSGEPYSYTFNVGSDNDLFGRQGNFESPYDNDLLYVPNPDGDPNVVYGPEFDQEAFFSEVAARGIRTGAVVDRNSDESNWDQLWNLRFQQELPFAGFGLDRFEGNRLKFVVDVENFPALLNEDWGTDYDGYGFDTAPVVQADLVTRSDVALNGAGGATALSGNQPAEICVEANTCQYRYNSFDFDPTAFEDPAGSVYRIRIGLRYEF